MCNQQTLTKGNIFRQEKNNPRHAGRKREQQKGKHVSWSKFTSNLYTTQMKMFYEI